MRWTEYMGVGQSGYNAGRHEHDPALEREETVRNPTYPRGADEEEEIRKQLDTDDRWSGRGGTIPPDAPS